MSIFIEGKGGLCNSLFQIATAINFKNKYNFDDIILDEKSYLLHYGTSGAKNYDKLERKRKMIVAFDIFNRKKQLIINNKEISYKDSLLKKFKWGLIKKDSFVYESVKNMPYSTNSCININFDDIEEIGIHNKNNPKNKKNILLKGLFQNFNYFDGVRLEFLNSLNLNKQEVLKKYPNIENGIMIGLRGDIDYKNALISSNQFILNSKSYELALNKLYKMYPETKKSPLFIISDLDNIWTKMRLNKKYPATEINENDVFQFNAGILCKHYIPSCSTFHWMISYLGEKKDSKILYFDNHIISRQNLVKPHWIPVYLGEKVYRNIEYNYNYYVDYITFGIITKSMNENIDLIIKSIEKQKIPNYEIIIVFDEPYTKKIQYKNCYVDFINTKIRKEYLCRYKDYMPHINSTNMKKMILKNRKYNLISNVSRFDNIVLMNDYLIFDNDWYKGFKKFCKKNTFDFLTNKILYNNKRYIDWISAVERVNNKKNNNYGALVPYNITCIKSIKEYMIYFPSPLLITKKYILNKFIFNQVTYHTKEKFQDMSPGEGLKYDAMEQGYDMNINIYSKCYLIKKSVKNNENIQRNIRKHTKLIKNNTLENMKNLCSINSINNSNIKYNYPKMNYYLIANNPDNIHYLNSKTFSENDVIIRYNRSLFENHKSFKNVKKCMHFYRRIGDTYNFKGEHIFDKCKCEKILLSDISRNKIDVKKFKHDFFYDNHKHLKKNFILNNKLREPYSGSISFDYLKNNNYFNKNTNIYLVGFNHHNELNIKKHHKHQGTLDEKYFKKQMNEFKNLKYIDVTNYQKIN